MNLTPQVQALNTQATALQHQLQNSMHAGTNPSASLMHHEVTALKNDIVSGKNSVVLKERMKRINTMIQNDQRMHYQPPAPSYQAGHFGDPMHTGAGMPNQNSSHQYGPVLTHNESNRMQFGLRQMGATLDQRPKF